MTATISTTALGRRYRDQAALEDVTLMIEPGTVTGLLGRNGAGKTTLMRLITGQEFPTTGTVQVFGETPAENDAVLRRMIFVREEQAYPHLHVAQVVQVASWFYPNWDAALAAELIADFGLPPRRQIRRLSRGMRSAVGIVIGLASRPPAGPARPANCLNNWTDMVIIWTIRAGPPTRRHQVQAGSTRTAGGTRTAAGPRTAQGGRGAGWCSRPGRSRSPLGPVSSTGWPT